MSEPIVITGLGTFGAAGRNCVELWENCAHGRTPAQMRDFSGTRLPVYAAPDPELNQREKRLARFAGRSATLALAAAAEAWRDARLDSGAVDPTRIGLILGTSRGPADVVDASLLRESKRPSDAVYTAFSSTAGIVASALEIEGCAVSVSATCTSGATAIYLARQLLLAGEYDVILAGGLDASLVDSIVQRMDATGVLANPGKCEDALRPFDLARSGTVLGEGAAVLVLETARSAGQRGAAIHGKLLGASVSCEPNARTRPTENGEGMQRAIRACLALAGVGSVDLVHLHGTGTRVNDELESICINQVFGPLESQPTCWGSKGVTGHTLGAASSFQAVLTLLAIRHGYLPQTANCFEQDPACAIRLIRGAGIAQKIRIALCTTSGFWGKNSCLALAAPDY